MAYRKSVQGDVALLPELPILAGAQGNYVERNSKPVSGQLCDRCQLMIREGDCTPLASIRFSSSQVG